ncbi:hypothetical protein Tco_0713446 [Tanacetum coccineum]
MALWRHYSSESGGTGFHEVVGLCKMPKVLCFIGLKWVSIVDDDDVVSEIWVGGVVVKGRDEKEEGGFVIDVTVVAGGVGKKTHPIRAVIVARVIPPNALRLRMLIREESILCVTVVDTYVVALLIALCQIYQCREKCSDVLMSEGCALNWDSLRTCALSLTMAFILMKYEYMIQHEGFVES